MKLATTALVAGLAGAAPASANLIISELVDGDLSGGLPKFVEITNTGNNAVDLSNYSIGNINNGGISLGGGASFGLSGVLAAGDSWVISYENNDTPGSSTFFNVYGFDADELGLGAFINGDDVIALFDGPAAGDAPFANIVDIYGVIGTDGTGEVWEYTDGFAFRNASVGTSSSTFNPSEWTFGGAGSLDAATDPERIALLLANTTPGRHSFGSKVIPTPGALGLFAVAGVAGLRRRRSA